MSTLLLQLETALADARASLDKADEKLHDTGVQHALAKSVRDAAADAVRRIEGAINSMHGVAAAPSAPTIAPPPKKRREPVDTGPACPSCGTPGRLSYVMRGSMKFVQCGECNAETQAL